MIKPSSTRSISLIIAALNEEGVIEATVREVVAEVAPRFSQYEIILVDDGSSDRTGEIMDSLGAEFPAIRVIHNPRNLGLGRTYSVGVDAARYEYVMLLCGDGGLPASSLPDIFDAVGSADIIIPYMLNLKRIKTPARYVLSRGYSGLMNLMFGQKITYYNGLPVHRRDYLRRIRITSTGFGFQGEILIKLLKAGSSYREIGVNGAELTNSSSALRPRNLVSVLKTVIGLIWELARFAPPDLASSETRAAGPAPERSKD
jgi:dolichol-phosphate mannosyltransferase